MGIAFLPVTGVNSSSPGKYWIPATCVHPVPGLDNVMLMNQTELGRRCVEESEQTPATVLAFWAVLGCMNPTTNSCGSSPGSRLR